MAGLILYHGSSEIVSHPTYGKGKINNDYGRGFYCTEQKELAQEWACGDGIDGYVNQYQINLDGLSILNLSSDRYTILNWLALLLDNRKPNLFTPLAEKGKNYLLENFLPDIHDADVIIGYRADDSYFSFARSFVSNEISLHQLGYAMRLGKPGEQIVLKTKKAFDSLAFLDYSFAESSLYYPKRKERDEKARQAFRQEMTQEDIDGIFMRDLIRENIKNDDPRLR